MKYGLVVYDCLGGRYCCINYSKLLEDQPIPAWYLCWSEKKNRQTCQNLSTIRHYCRFYRPLMDQDLKLSIEAI